MRKSKPSDPLLQQIKGVFIFEKGEDSYKQALALLKTLDCHVMGSKGNHTMVQTTRGRLQSIKKCWLAKDKENALSRELNECVQQIIIGGNV